MKNNKIKSITAALCAGIFSLGLVSTAHATLESRLGGLAYYDTDLDITWLADANAGAGSSFDDGFATTDGLMTWANANAWAASLNVGGVTGWRLPTSLNSDGSGPCSGFNCTDSEMGHLFYNELGGATGSSILTSGDPDLALFSNIQPNGYWSGTEHAPFPVLAWNFNFNRGNLFWDTKNSNLFAWAVHSGDVDASSVPEPGTVALMGLGLMGLLGLGRRQRRR